MHKVSALVLAGGEGRRMGGVDKALQVVRGRPMIEHVLERIAPQVDEVIINANRNHDVFTEYVRSGIASKIVSDELSGFQGPLAGFYAGLQVVSHPLMITVPCDSPFLPIDLVERMTLAINQQRVSVALAKSSDQVQPVFCLMRVTTELRESLRVFLESGQRKIDIWTAQHNHLEVEFDDHHAFANINTPDELQRYQ
jgi:molybdenum cofactor guanylyltransferase